MALLMLHKITVFIFTIYISVTESVFGSISSGAGQSSCGMSVVQRGRECQTMFNLIGNAAEIMYSFHFLLLCPKEERSSVLYLL